MNYRANDILKTAMHRRALLVLVPAFLLSAPPEACFSMGFSEGCQYLLVFSPLYLWLIVAGSAVLELATRRKPALESREATV